MLSFKKPPVSFLKSDDKFIWFKIVSKLEYSSDDVRDLSLRLKAFEGHAKFNRSGLFLSALVNKGKDEDYVILTEHLEKKLDYLGYRNTKNLTVIGDAGNLTGWRMSGGSVKVDGDAGDGTGWAMSGGSVIIEGDAGDYIGYWMSNGSVKVDGDAGAWVGLEMSGGVIRLLGDYGSISSFLGLPFGRGEVWHCDRLMRASPKRWLQYVMGGGSDA